MVKRLCFLCLWVTIWALPASAQEPMPVVWQMQVGHAIKFSGIDDRPGIHLGFAASDKEITIFDLDSGHTRWTRKFSELDPELRAISDMIPIWQDSLLLLLSGATNIQSHLSALRLSDGRLLWTTERFHGLQRPHIERLTKFSGLLVSHREGLALIQPTTGDLLWQAPTFHGPIGPIHETKDGFLLIAPSNGEGNHNRLFKINPKTGEVAWEQAYLGEIERKVVTREVQARLWESKDRVFLQTNGLQVFDYRTSQPLWQARFESPASVLPRPAVTGQLLSYNDYCTIAEPLFNRDSTIAYCLDFTTYKHPTLNQISLADGQKLWTAELPIGTLAAPNLFLHEGRIIVQIGGLVEQQALEQKRNTDGSIITKSLIRKKPVSPTGLIGFDVTDGHIVWQSEHLKLGLLQCGFLGQLFACTDKELLILSPTTGQELAKADITSDMIGAPQYLVPHTSNHQPYLAVIGEKGLTLHTLKDASLVFPSHPFKIVVALPGPRDTNTLLMQATNGDLASYSLLDGTYLYYRASSDAQATLTEDGKRVIVFDGTRKGQIKCLNARLP